VKIPPSPRHFFLTDEILLTLFFFLSLESQKSFVSAWNRQIGRLHSMMVEKYFSADQRPE